MNSDDIPAEEIKYPYMKDGKLVFRPTNREPFKYPKGTVEGEQERYERRLASAQRSQKKRRAAAPPRQLLTPEERSNRNREAAQKHHLRLRAAREGVSLAELIAGIESGLYPADLRRRPREEKQPKPPAKKPQELNLNYDPATEYVFNGTVRKRVLADPLLINPVSKLATSKINPLDTGYLSDSYWNKFKNPKIPGRRK